MGNGSIISSIKSTYYDVVQNTKRYAGVDEFLAVGVGVIGFRVEAKIFKALFNLPLLEQRPRQRLTSAAQQGLFIHGARCVETLRQKLKQKFG